MQKPAHNRSAMSHLSTFIKVEVSVFLDIKLM